MKFNILSTTLSEHTKETFTPGYLHAWNAEVYPTLDTAAEWHLPFKEQFKIKELKMDKLYKLLCDIYDSKKYLSFYELEEALDSDNWNSYDLITACRYFYLHSRFNHTFWSNLLKNGKCPSEAFTIQDEFSFSEIRFM